MRAWPVEAMPFRVALQQVQLVRPRHCRCARGAAELGVGVLKMTMNRVLAEHEPGCDVAVGKSLRDEAQDLDLASGEDCVATDVAPRFR